MKKNPKQSAFERDYKIYYNMDGTSVSVRLRKRLRNIQLEGNKLNGISYQDHTVMEFNPLQRQLYCEVVYGVKNLKPKERTQMTEVQLGLIEERYTKAQRVINQLKNEIMSKYCDKIFKVFYNSPIAKEMLHYSQDPENENNENTMTFADLGINKYQIATRLIEHGVLPVNFFQLSA
jgi:hypothetical protein